MPNSVLVNWLKCGSSCSQGLTLVRCSAQLEPFLTQKHTPITPDTAYHPLNTPQNNPSLHPLSHRRRFS